MSKRYIPYLPTPVLVSVVHIIDTETRKKIAECTTLQVAEAICERLNEHPLASITAEAA